MNVCPRARIVLAACLLLASGCSAWRTPTFDLNRLRDPRAVDIDQRLATPQPTVNMVDSY